MLLNLLKLFFPLLKEYGISNLRIKRGGKNIVFLATCFCIFILTMFNSYSIEQATVNLRLHEPLARQYQSLERNNQRLTQQLESSRQSQYACDSLLQEYKEKVPYAHLGASAYDPDKKIMVQLQQDNAN